LQNVSEGKSREVYQLRILLGVLGALAVQCQRFVGRLLVTG